MSDLPGADGVKRGPVSQRTLLIALVTAAMAVVALLGVVTGLLLRGSPAQPAPAPATSPAPVSTQDNSPADSTSTSTTTVALTLRSGVTVEGPWSDHYGSGRLIGARGDCAVDADRYPDIQRGSQVTVKDDSGRVVGTGTLHKGRLVNPHPVKWPPFEGLTSGYTDLEGPCRYRFTVANLPGSAFYTLQLGGRNPVTVTREQVEADTVPDISVPKLPPR
jgi:hypothetical protein